MGQTDCDVIIIGAGLLGCAAARALMRYDLRIIVLEKSSDVSTGISKANSGIIYAGYDDTPGSLKADMVVRASAGLPDLCSELDVHYRRTGSIMIGFGDRADKVIRGKFDQGMANKVPGLRLISGEEVRDREPLIAEGVRIGLYAPGTATLDPWELCIALYENAAANGADFRFGEEVCSVSKVSGSFVTETACGTYSSKMIINCAGLSTDKIREMALAPRIRIVPNACDYYVFGIPENQSPSHVIFHEPETKGKGLTLIPTVRGEILAGSTQRKNPETEGIPTSEEGLRKIMDMCREVVPEMPVSPVIHSFAALRPNPFEVQAGDNGEFRFTDRRLKDFNILEEDGLISLMGIKTPGLTCCMELGEYVARKVTDHLGCREAVNSDFDPERRGIRRFSDIPSGELAAAVSKDPYLGRIICTCRNISESEIREAILRGASTLDGVKRRTGILMGPCQGSKCLQQVIRIMSEVLGISPYQIVKDAGSSQILEK